MACCGVGKCDHTKHLCFTCEYLHTRDIADHGSVCHNCIRNLSYPMTECKWEAAKGEKNE
jgi:hypothetical protein